MAARNLDLPPGAVFHSDRESNYTSAALGRLRIRQSEDRAGTCFDNSLAESFNVAMKVDVCTAQPARR